MNILDKIKNLVFSLEDNTETKFEDLKLEDGTMIKTSTETLEVGSKVAVVSEDNTESVPPAGEHVLDSGDTIITDESGTVVEIRKKDDPVEEQEMSESAADEVAAVADEVVDEATAIVDEATPDEVSEEDAAIISEAVVALVEEKVAAMEEEMMKKMKEQMSILQEMAETQESFKSEFEAIKASPSGTPISQTQFSANAEKLDPMADRIARIKALRNK